MRRNFIVWELILCQVYKDSIFPLVKFEREDNLRQCPSHHLKIFEVSLNEMHCSSSLCVHRCRGDDRRQTSCGLRSAVMRKQHEKSNATWEVSLSPFSAGLISRRMWNRTRPSLSPLNILLWQLLFRSWQWFSNTLFIYAAHTNRQLVVWPLLGNFQLS